MFSILLENGDDILIESGDKLLLEQAAGGATAPGSIVDLAATPGVGSLAFTWTPPNDGGSAITKHTLYLNGVLHIDNVTSPCNVNGLAHGVVSGPWTVTSTNSVGESLGSNEVFVATLSSLPRLRDVRRSPRRS